MGTKIKKIIIPIMGIFLSIPFFSCSIPAKSIFVNEAKGVALCRCLSILNHNIDSSSLILRDYSLSYFIEYSSLSPESIYQINSHVDSIIFHYIEIPKEIGGNMAGYSCWKYYESKDLELFLKKLYKMQKTGYPMKS